MIGSLGDTSGVSEAAHAGWRCPNVCQKIKNFHRVTRNLCVLLTGSGVAVSRALSSREEGIQQEWCQTLKSGGSGEGEERAGGFLCRPGCNECFTDPCSDGSVGTVVTSLNFLFHVVLEPDNWGHCCSTGYIRNRFTASALYWHATSSYVIPFCFLRVGYSLAICTSANRLASPMP